MMAQNCLEFDDKKCPYFEAETRLLINGSEYNSYEEKDRYDTMDCRDFRITSSGYIFVQYEASCLDKDGKGKDSTGRSFKSLTNKITLFKISCMVHTVWNPLKVMSTLRGSNLILSLHWFTHWSWPRNQGRY